MRIYVNQEKPGVLLLRSGGLHVFDVFIKKVRQEVFPTIGPSLQMFGLNLIFRGLVRFFCISFAFLKFPSARESDAAEIVYNVFCKERKMTALTVL